MFGDKLCPELLGSSSIFAAVPKTIILSLPALLSCFLFQEDYKGEPGRECK